MINARAVRTEKCLKSIGDARKPIVSGGSIPPTSFEKLIIDEFEYFISGFYGDDRMRTDVYDEIMEYIEIVREVFEK